MIVPGLASVCLRQLKPPEIVAMTQRLGLKAIEWGGDVHAPPDNISRVRAIGRMSRETGLQVASYGSYFRLGENQEFLPWLQAAQALRAPNLRIWAGRESSSTLSPPRYAALVDELRSHCEIAHVAGITVSLEFHENTAADSAAATLRLLRDVNHGGLRTYWQEPLGAHDTGKLRSDVESLRPWLSNLHVLAREPLPPHTPVALATRSALWTDIFRAVQSGSHHALIEFVRDDRPEALAEDARTLLALLERATSGEIPAFKPAGARGS